MRRALIAWVLAIPIVANGGTSARNSYATVSADGRSVLVMVSDYVSEPRVTATLPGGRQVVLRDMFEKSGVYDARTFTPLWQVDWYALQCDLRYSPDFRSVVRINRRGFHVGAAITFYEEGRLIRSYNCGELLTGMRSSALLPYTTWDWHTEWYDGFALSSDGTRVNLSTARRRLFFAEINLDLGLREAYVFDLKSGSMLNCEVRGRWLIWAYAALGLAAVIVPTVGLRMLLRLLKSRLPRRGFEVG